MFPRALRSVGRRLGIKAKAPTFNPAAPFGNVLHASRETYQRLHYEACKRVYPTIDAFIDGYAHQIELTWMHELALHTQVVVKQSELNFQHGRVLYSIFREYIDAHDAVDQFTVLETGTSRGFSIICLSRALTDSGRDGKLITLDIIEHNRRHLWNCIDDLEGPKTRHELLAPWSTERDRVVFLAGDSRKLCASLGLGRIHFAFLDGGHTAKIVLDEYRYVAARQEVGDIIVFDDVTPGVFDGIVEAVNEIQLEGKYCFKMLEAEQRRAYAIATRSR